MDFYEKTFYKPAESKQLYAGYVGRLAPEFNGFQWECRLDEDHVDDTNIGSIEDYTSTAEYRKYKSWFNRQLTKSHRSESYTDSTGKTKALYSFKKGCVWIGEIKSQIFVL